MALVVGIPAPQYNAEEESEHIIKANFGNDPKISSSYRRIGHLGPGPETILALAGLLQLPSRQYFRAEQ